MFVKIATPARVGVGTIVSTQDGRLLEGVRAIDVRIRPNEVIRATLEIAGEFCGEAQSDFVVLHPVTGDLRSVKRIEFADGTIWEPEA